MQEMMTANQEKIEIKIDAIQEKKGANLREIIVEMKDGRKERIAGQEGHGGQCREDEAKSRSKGGRGGAAGEF